MKKLMVFIGLISLANACSVSETSRSDLALEKRTPREYTVERKWTCSSYNWMKSPNVEAHSFESVPIGIEMFGSSLEAKRQLFVSAKNDFIFMSLDVMEMLPKPAPEYDKKRLYYKPTETKDDNTRAHLKITINGQDSDPYERTISETALPEEDGMATVWFSGGGFVDLKGCNSHFYYQN